MIEVQKKQTLHANLQVDGDKSLTIRAVLLGAIALGKTVIKNALISDDTLASIDCARKMGAKVLLNGNEICITGVKNIANGQEYDCKNSATLARLLTGILAGANVHAVITGDESLKTRPMNRICEPLTLRGAQIESNSGKLPLIVKPAKLKDFTYQMQVDSAQVKSAIILSGVTGGCETTVIENNPTRDHTEKMLPLFGIKTKTTGKAVTVKSGQLNGCNIDIPCDPSSASFYLALGLLLGEVTVKNLLITPLRFGFYQKLKQAGAKIALDNIKQTPFGEVANITFYKSKLEYFEVDAQEIPAMIDELPLLACLGALNGGCLIKDAKELKVKESNRLQSTLDLIIAFGGNAQIDNDSLKVFASGEFKYFTYQSTDHRMAMCAYLLMTALKGGKLLNEEVAFISFPNFYKNINELSLGLIGGDLSQSKSGEIHKLILNAFGVQNFTYECNSLLWENLDEFFKKCPYKAFNATIPYKTTVANSYNGEEAVQLSDSSNYVCNSTAYTTDGEGLLFALKYYGKEVCGKNVLVYGVGGAGRSIAYSLLKAGANVYLQNRTKEKVFDFCEKTHAKVYGGERCDILINATSVSDKPLFSEEQISHAETVVDINYGKNSETLKFAQKFGVFCCDGEAMLFFQAYISDCILLNKKADFNEGEKLFKEYKEISNG